MAGEFAKLTHRAILGNPVPLKVLAKRIGKPYSTLLREVNPYDQGAKLGVETFIEIVKITGEISLIEHIANEFGLAVVPKKLSETG